MPRPIKLFSYDPSWPDKFEIEAKEIKAFLSSKCIEVHHFGSTSISGMTAKEDLDILCLVTNLSDSLLLQEYGYVFKGELNIPLRYFFSKNTSRSKVNLHVCEPNHSFIALNLSFRDYLRTHPREAKAYAQVKLEALKHPKPHEKIRFFLTHYGLAKNQLIKRVIQKMQFKGYLVNFCMHENEWDAYFNITKKQLRNLPKISPQDFYLCLSQGAVVIGIAHLTFVSEKEAHLLQLLIDPPYQKQGAGTWFLHFIEKWLLSKKIKTLRVQGTGKSEAFFEKQGYLPCSTSTKKTLLPAIRIKKLS